MFTKEVARTVDDVLKARWSCRSFDDYVPSKEELEAVIAAGMISPYASIASKDVVPFRHFFVMKKGDERLPVIDRLIREQSAEDLAQVEKEAEKDEFLKNNMDGLRALWSNAAEHGLKVFPDPPSLIVVAEWRGARRAERQSLAHMLQNMWIKATSMNLDFLILSAVESMAGNREFCELFGLPADRYGFHACVIGHHAGSIREPRPATCEIHWL